MTREAGQTLDQKNAEIATSKQGAHRLKGELELPQSKKRAKINRDRDRAFCSALFTEEGRGKAGIQLDDPPACPILDEEAADIACRPASQ